MTKTGAIIVSYFLLRELPSLVKGAGLRIQSYRSSGVQIPLPAFIYDITQIIIYQLKLTSYNKV